MLLRCPVESKYDQSLDTTTSSAAGNLEHSDFSGNSVGTGPNQTG